MAFGFDKLAGMSLSPWSHGGLVAIDFGSQMLKVLQLTPGETPHLTAIACVQTPPEIANDAVKRLEFQCEQLPGLMKSGGFKAKRGVCSIPTAHLYCKHLQVQPEEKQSIEDATVQQIALQLGCEASMLSCRTLVAAGAQVPSGKTEVIALATASSLVGRLMQAMRAAKLEPAGMQTEFQAILNAFKPVNRRSTDQDVVTLYLDIGAQLTNVCIGHGANLVFAKSITMGGRTFDQIVAQQAGCALPEARALRLGLQSLTPPRTQPQAQADSAGMAVLAAAMRKEQLENGATATVPATDAPAPHQAAAALSNAASKSKSAIDLSLPLRSLTDEIMMCVRYYDAIFPTKRVARVIFLGGESRHTALCQHIARTLKIPASAADPLARVARTGSEPVSGVDLSQPQPGWAVAYGLIQSPTDV